MHVTRTGILCSMEIERSLEVPVRGGLLTVGASGPDPALAEHVVLFVHGMTANHKTWSLITQRLPPSIAALAVDLRGRGGSVGLPAPWGMEAHADDLASVLNYVGVDECVVVGHSMGGFVATAFGRRYPERLRGAVLVDGGVALAQPANIDPDDVIEAVIGPAMSRLRQTFASRADYQAFWRSHPSFSDEGVWNAAITTFFDYDLGGVEPSLASRVSEAAVRVDGAEVLLDPSVMGAASFLDCPTELIRVERGVLNQPEPLVAVTVAADLARENANVRVTSVPGLNHYTITLTPAGADVVAASLHRVLLRVEVSA